MISCFYSSFVFLLISIIAIFTRTYIYSLLFFILFTTSIIVHSQYANTYFNILDKISILAIVLYGGFTFINKINTINTIRTIRTIDNGIINVEKYYHILIIISTFLTTIYLYYFGFIYNKYCFCQEPQIANLYHSLLHVISFLGHLMIILL